MDEDELFDRYSDVLSFEADIGSGSFGRVVRAYDHEIERIVAIKILLKKNLHGDEINRLRSEATILQSMRHENIV